MSHDPEGQCGYPDTSVASYLENSSVQDNGSATEEKSRPLKSPWYMYVSRGHGIGHVTLRTFDIP